MTAASATDTVLDGAMAVTMGPDQIIPDSEIVIRAGRLQAVRPRSRRRRRRSDIIDCSHRIALPGLFNAHLHSEFLLLKSLVEDKRLRQWEETDL